MQETVGEVLDEDQYSAWEEVQPLWTALSQGNHKRVSVGVEGADLEAQVVEQWRQYYGLTDAQADHAGYAATRMLDAAREIIAPHIEDRIRRGDLDSEAKLVLEAAFREIQLSADRDIVRGLSEDQIEAARTRLLLLFEFEIGNRFDIHPETGRGF